MGTPRRKAGGASISATPDLRLYAGRWVALSGGRVVGVGATESEAYLAAKGSRPKEEPAALLYVEPVGDGLDLQKAARSLFAAHSVAGQAREILLSGARQCYLVGGSVRDLVLERPSHDLDFSVDEGALALGRRMADAFGWGFFPLDSGRGTARVVGRDAAGERICVDIATLYGGSIESDLAQRDFTLNAMAIELCGLRLVDRHGGMEDMQGRRLRLVAPDGIAADPIRALRAVRQAAELGLTIEGETEAAICRDGSGLASVAQERIRDEVVRILSQPAAAGPIGRLAHLDLLRYIGAELLALRGVTQSLPHRLDVWEHTLLTLTRLEQALAILRGGPASARFDEALLRFGPALRNVLDTPMSDARPRWLLLKLAALLHDIGKPSSRSIDETGRTRFLGHEKRGAEIAGEMTSRLRFSAAEADYVALVVRQHMRPFLLTASGGVSNLAAHRYYRDVGSVGVDIALLYLADLWALSPGSAEPVQAPAAVQTINALWTYWFSRSSPERQKPLVSGRDLIEQCGMDAGPHIGRWLQRVREEQIAGSISTREEALRWITENARRAESS